jgi:alkanesulfonate monooxygenase SsuD/methylene tetrahydromethanopterin reductase-like flavin-dependent oxidoreductase (luciferase family)
VRIGVAILPDVAWPEWRRRVQLLDDIGVEHAWTYDHLAWRDLRDGPWLAAMPLLTAAATATDRIRLGTLVASPNFRHPVLFAKELVALDRISAGRAIAGVGAGAVTGWDTHMLGQAELTGRERADRYAEFVEVLALLLRDGAASYQGKWYVARRGAHSSGAGPATAAPPGDCRKRSGWNAARCRARRHLDHDR